MRMRILFLLAAVVVLLPNPVSPQTAGVKWKRLSSTTGDIPLPVPGKQQTASLVLDIDRNGVNDIVITERTEAPSVVWLRRTAEGWERYVIDGSKQRIEAGGAYHDIDGDGDLDIVFGGDAGSNKVWWWENPCPDYDPQTPWTRHEIKNSGKNKHHDQMFGDFDGDGKTELAFWNQGDRKLFLAEIPENPRTASTWEYTAIYSWSGESEPPQRGTYPQWKGVNEHEGLAQADIDGDGKIDIIGGGRWFRHEDGTRFSVGVIDESYPFSRAAAGQIIPGGRPEVIFVVGDGIAPLMLYEWKGNTWQARELVPDIDNGHSLALMDFDHDGNLDIFSAEMRLNGGNPDAKARILFGDGRGYFRETVAVEGFGLHESRLADLDGDGDFDILGKPYNWEVPRIDIWLNESCSSSSGSSGGWTYIQVDGGRGKWGDWNQPEWLKYFGLDAADITGDGCKDIVSGRYFYRNPGGDMSGNWERTDFGANLDGMLFVDTDGDRYGDIIAEALPDVYWLEAVDTRGSAWKVRKIASIPKTAHVNGQGYTLAQIVPGGKPEILLSSGEGIWCIEIPPKPESDSWYCTRIAAEATEEGIGVGDIDRDGFLDIASGFKEKDEGMSVAWWRNPGSGGGDWEYRIVGTTVYFADRAVIADMNGDGRADIVITEERWPEPEGASVFWFEQRAPLSGEWSRHTVTTRNTSNSLDVADIDHDGDPDIVTAEHRGAKRVALFENDGTGLFREHTVSAGKENHLGARVFDLDGDGDPDIIGIAWDDYRFLHLWRNETVRYR